MLIFHTAREWLPEQVRLRRAPSTWKTNPTIDARIGEAWDAARARLGDRLFDGLMSRLESWKVLPDQLELELSETSYRVFLGTNLMHPELADQFGRSGLANPVGVSPALETADGWLMMGRRNSTVAYYPRRVHPFAGALEPADENVFDAVRRELREELSFGESDIAEIFCTGIAEDISIRQPELIFRVRSTRTQAEIDRQIDTAEHHDALSIRATEAGIDALLAEADELTPVGIASLLLWGRSRLGEDWWDRHVKQNAAGFPTWGFSTKAHG